MSNEGVINILGFAQLTLPGPYGWVADDFVEGPAVGSIFQALDPESGDENIGSLMVADISNDPTEPSLDPIALGDLPAIDRALHEAIAVGLAAEGMKLVNWVPSRVLELFGGRRLESQYLVQADTGEWRYYAHRLMVGSRRIAIIGCANAAGPNYFLGDLLQTMWAIRFTEN